MSNLRISLFNFQKYPTTQYRTVDSYVFTFKIFFKMRFNIALHGTSTEADKIISCPLTAPLVDLLSLTPEVPGFSQRPNNITMQATP